MMSAENVNRYSGSVPRWKWVRKNCATGTVRPRQLHDQRRHEQDRRGEDDRDDAGHVDLQRDVRGRPTEELAAHLVSAVLDRDPALRLFDEDHQPDDRHPTSKVRRNANGPELAQIARNCCGMTEMIDTKMRMDMPLPMPRSVMSSPIHMTVAVPAVMVSTITIIAAGVVSGTICS